MQHRIACGLGFVALFAIACGATSSTEPNTTGSASSPIGVGDPCTPAQESSPSFAGFGESEVSIERQNAACGPGENVCLVNHFRGAVSTPYGGPHVKSQCVDRTAKLAVYCSCRCANAEGRTDDGATYCACGADLQCTSLVASIGRDTGMEGSYCIKPNTAYDRDTACRADCDPKTHNCD